MVVADSSTPRVSTDVTKQLQRLTDGDTCAKEWIYRRFSPSLYRRIRHRYGTDPKLDAEELLHDLFVWCYQNEGKILAGFLDRNSVENRTEFRLEGYLWGLVSGLVANKRRGRRRNVDPIALDLLGELSAGDSERSAAERDTLVRLMDCLHERGAKVFLYFVLRFVEGLTPEEVAEVTGWPRTKIYKLKTALNRAVDQCVQLLGL